MIWDHEGVGSNPAIPIYYCGMEQLEARWAHNPKAVGSSPTSATKVEI